MKTFWNSGSPYARIVQFIGKTCIFYFILNYFFIVYTGFTIPGGTFYSPFLLEHADFVSPFRQFLLWGGAQFASLLGYPSGYTDYTMFVRGGSAVRMVYSCLGFNLMAAYAALVLAWPATWKYRAVSLVTGLVTIILLNMVRLGGLAVLYTNGHHSLFNYIDHHDLFNIIVIAIIFLFLRCTLGIRIEK